MRRKPHGYEALRTGRHTVYVERELYKLTKAIADARGQSWSDYVEMALREQYRYDTWEKAAR
jgi:hypothetical protein